MFSRNHDPMQQMKDQAATMAQSIIEQAASRAVYGAGKTRDAASSAKGRLPRLQKKSAEDLAPSMREVALQAAAAALDLWQTARERAEEVVETAEHKYGGPAVDAIGRAGRSAVGAATHVVDDAAGRAKHAASYVTDRAEDAGGRVKHAASHAADRAEEATGRAKEATRHAADATVSTSKDTGAALFWTAAAAGIVFYALLDKERRDQVLKVVDTVVSQARDVIRDFQGYDEEFA